MALGRDRDRSSLLHRPKYYGKSRPWMEPLAELGR